MKRLAILLLFIGLASLAKAQAPLTLGVSYWGEFAFHPGLKISMDFQPLGKIKFKDHKKKDLQKIRSHVLFTTPHLGYFVHPGNHQALTIGADIGYRLFVGRNKAQSYKTAKGFVFEVFANLDYMLQINSAATYTLDADGNVMPVAGLRSYFLVGSSLGFGYRFGKPNMTILARPNLSWQMPYDAIVLPRVFMELAVLFPLTNKNSN